MEAPKIVGESAEAVAYALMVRILEHENAPPADGSYPEWILNIYKACVRAVR